MQRHEDELDRELSVSPSLGGYEVTDWDRELRWLNTLEMRPEPDRVVNKKDLIEYAKRKFLESNPTHEEQLAIEQDNYSSLALANFYFSKNKERQAVENAEDYLIEADCTKEPALSLVKRLVVIYTSKSSLYMSHENRKKLIEKLNANGLLSVEDYNAIKKTYDYRHLMCFFTDDAETIGSPKESRQELTLINMN